MGIFRFSNAVSDIRKFIDTYKILYDELKETPNFTHDDATKALIKNSLVSSSGSIGAEALSRSTREDRSRDPLYNQSKMYSEIYRMLGWYWPGTKRTNFVIPEYGEYIYDASGDLLKSHFELNTLHIVSPNPLVTIRGENILRPFPLLLKLLNRLEGIIHRDEIILTVLACNDDREADYIDTAVKMIQEIRGDKDRLDSAYFELMKQNNVNSPDVFRNYTRFILATLKWLNYAIPERVRDLYGSKSIQIYRQTEYAKHKAVELESMIDIRASDIQGYSLDEKAAFSLYALYYHLGKLGYDLSQPDTVKTLQSIKEICATLLEDFRINKDEPFMYFPYQESSLEVMQHASKMFE